MMDGATFFYLLCCMIILLLFIGLIISWFYFKRRKLAAFFLVAFVFFGFLFHHLNAIDRNYPECVGVYTKVSDLTINDSNIIICDTLILDFDSYIRKANASISDRGKWAVYHGDTHDYITMQGKGLDQYSLYISDDTIQLIGDKEEFIKIK